MWYVVYIMCGLWLIHGIWYTGAGVCGCVACVGMYVMCVYAMYLVHMWCVYSVCGMCLGHVWYVWYIYSMWCVCWIQYMCGMCDVLYVVLVCRCVCVCVVFTTWVWQICWLINTHSPPHPTFFLVNSDFGCSPRTTSLSNYEGRSWLVQANRSAHCLAKLLFRPRNVP